jgi:hypothetical protein
MFPIGEPYVLLVIFAMLAFALALAFGSWRAH